jgi:two-component system chemotaxis response regulator CheY
MRVLIVDDDVVSRMMLLHMVDAAGHGADVLEAEDGEDAWRQLDGGAAPAIVFCDLRMPRVSGMELLARLKADPRFTQLPVVLVSAAGDAATMEQALGLGAAGYIVKPFDGARVAAYLARLGATPAEEAADAVMRRLSIDCARLLLYLGGLQRQLAGAMAELDALRASGAHEAARTRLARLAEGCRTRGLWAAADGLEALAAAAVPDCAATARVFEQAGAAVLRQSEAAHRLC